MPTEPFPVRPGQWRRHRAGKGSDRLRLYPRGINRRRGRTVRGNGPRTPQGAGSGTFTTTTAGVAAGQVLLTVPGVAGPNDAVLIVTAEGGGRRNAGNIVSYEWNSARSGYVVESRHLTDDNSNVPDLESVGPEPMFSFALVRTKPQISVEEPAATRRANGSAVKFGDAPRGSPVTKTFTIRNNRAGSLHLSSVTKDGPAAADYTLDTTGMAASLANGETTTFSVTFAPGGDGSRIARVLIHSSSSEHPVYYLLLSSRGIPTPSQKPPKPPLTGLPAHSRQMPATWTSSPTSLLTIRRTNNRWRARLSAARAGKPGPGNARCRRTSGMSSRRDWSIQACKLQVVRRSTTWQTLPRTTGFPRMTKRLQSSTAGIFWFPHPKLPCAT